MSPSNEWTDQNLSYFQTGIGAAAYTTLDTEQLLFHTRTVLIDIIASLQGSDGGVITASEVHELPTKIHDILASAVSNWVGNMAHILACLFNTASRQHHEVWTFHFTFSQSKDSIPPSEVCLYACINWSLAQAHQQFSLGLSQSAACMRGAKAQAQGIVLV